ALKRRRAASPAPKAAALKTPKTIPAPSQKKKKAATAPTEKKPPAPHLPREAPAAPASAAAAPADPLTPAVGAPPPPRPPSRRRLKFVPRSRWRTAIIRVAAAVGVASLAVAYQEHALRSASPPAPSSQVAASAPSMQLVGHQGPVIAVASADE